MSQVPEPRPGCPHPEKVAHKSRRAAEKGMTRFEASQGIDLTLRAYKCECGAWHLGHSAKKKVTHWEIQNALRAGRRNAAQSRRRRKR